MVGNSRSGLKANSFGQKRPTKDYIFEKTYPLAQYFNPFGTYFIPQGPIYNRLAFFRGKN